MSTIKIYSKTDKILFNTMSRCVNYYRGHGYPTLTPHSVHKICRGERRSGRYAALELEYYAKEVSITVASSSIVKLNILTDLESEICKTKNAVINDDGTEYNYSVQKVCRLLSKLKSTDR